MAPPSVITIGNFDGVHCGHRAILARAAELAHSLDGSVTALTFDPHPATLLRPDAAPPRLTSLADKQQLLCDAGATDVQVLEPTESLLALSADAFVRWLVEHHRPVAMVEGADFRFGTGREGDVAWLTQLGGEHGFEVDIVESIDVALSDHQLAPVRSSLIRWLLGHGRVADAAICLGRPFALTGIVEQGEQRGRTIGVPTANLGDEALSTFVMPKDGVYAGLGELPDGSTFPAAISIGVKPTFADSARVVEAHLLNFSGDLYGQPLTLHLSRWLRDQAPFPSLDALQTQLTRDIEAVHGFTSQQLLHAPMRPSACP